MATKLTHDLTYDAPLTQVGEMLLDPAFRERVCEAQGATRRTATVSPEGGGMKVVVDQVQGADGIPGFAQKFVGDEILIVQTENWTSPTSADVRLTIPGKPGEAVGTMELVESGGTTTETIDLDLTVKIPLVGGKIEQLIAGIFSAALDVEQKVGREWLAR